MAKIKKEDNEEMERPTEDVRVEKPVFKSTLSAMIKKKPPEPQNKSKK